MKITFTDIEIKTIIELYTKDGLNTTKIGVKLGISKTPISRVLKDNGLLRKGNSDGVKIILSLEQQERIKELYLKENKNCDEIATEMKLTSSFINKFLSNTGYRRNKSIATSIAKTGVKLPQKIKDNMRKAQQLLAKSGNRKQTGGVCKTYFVNGLRCQGTYEKEYLNMLINNHHELPNEAEPIITPFGVYYPDFTFNDKFIEIKSDYTYDVLIGNKMSRFTKKIETEQYEKIKWVDKNIKPVDILVIDKRNNKIIKKEF